MAARRKFVAGAAWIAVACLLSGAPAAAQDLARGEALFELCGQCHGAQGQGNRLYSAPAIAGLDAWYVQTQLEKFKSGARGGHPGDIQGLRMRPMARTLKTEADIQAVAAYVGKLPAADPAPVLTGGDPARGETLYRPCTACHGAKAEGNKNLFGPPLHSNDWYQLAQLQKFQSGVRGTGPQDSTGAMMRPMAMTLKDEQAMLDVIAYIATLDSQ